MTDKKVVSLSKARADVNGALEVIETLKGYVEDGTVKAFTGVGITTDGDLTMFSAQVLPCGRLEIIGAVGMLHNIYLTGADQYE